MFIKSYVDSQLIQKFKLIVCDVYPSYMRRYLVSRSANMVALINKILKF